MHWGVRGLFTYVVLLQNNLTRFTHSSDLASCFVQLTLPKRSVSNETYTTIMFICAEAGYVSNTSNIKIVWPGVGNESAVCCALLSNTVFAEGATKKVFKVHNIHCSCIFTPLMPALYPQLTIESGLYIAKWFSKAGLGPVDPQDNATLLMQELVQLKQGQCFWSQFHILAKDKGMDICQGEIKFGLLCVTSIFTINYL
jgi:hypothetical protein